MAGNERSVGAKISWVRDADLSDTSHTSSGFSRLQRSRQVMSLVFILSPGYTTCRQR